MSTPIGERAIQDALKHGRAILKFISPNDLGLTGGHQAGYYLPIGPWRLFSPHPPEKGVNKDSFPEVCWQDGRVTQSRVIWYGKAKHEYRLTRFGRDFPWMAPDTVGDLLVLIPVTLDNFIAYVLDLEEDIDDILAALDVEIIDRYAVYEHDQIPEAETSEECIARKIREYVSGLDDFPITKVVSAETRRILQECEPEFNSRSPDNQLTRWLDEEYRLFQVAERKIYSPRITQLFKSIDDFIAVAQSILQRRKSRAGYSLQNQFEYLLEASEVPFTPQPRRVDGRPDVIIPSEDAYEDESYPVDRLCVVGIKTTCKDRWRQVLQEGKRVKHRYLLTTQQGISLNQVNEMHSANITLVVPEDRHSMYPKEIRPTLLKVADFIELAHQKVKE